MDTSKEYISMCEKAKEIQKLWKPSGGDYYLHNYRGITGLSPEMEKKYWPDDKEWLRIEILCYQPSVKREYWVYTDGNKSHVTSAKNILKHNCVWLPRQDQLQKIYIEYLERATSGGLHLAHMIVDFRSWFFWYEGYTLSMEQLWLAFVMDRVFNKTWGGKDWVEGGKQ